MGSSASCRLRVLLTLLCIVGCFLLVYLLVPAYIDSEIRRRVRDYIILRPGAAEDAYERFVNSTDPAESVYYTKFYFFNITNLEDVRQSGAKPVLREIGPYTYRTVEEKYDIAFHWNGSVSYKERAFYYREPKLTVGNFDDVVVTLNLALVAVLDRLYDEVNVWFLQRILSRIASSISRIGDGTSSGIFLTRRVEELLWGYDDPVLSAVSRFTDVSSEFSLMQNGMVADDGQEHTYDARSSRINSGLMDISKTGEFEMWNGVRAVENWNHHNETVHGTAGTFFPPFLKGDEALFIWVTEMFRAMKLRKEAEVTMFDIRMFRYRIDPAFWQPDPKYFGQYYGLVNVTQFSADGSKGPPLFFSLPHFCDADPVLSEGVIGLECENEERDFFVDVEPYTGIALRGAIRFMISTEYSPKFDAIDPNLTRTVLPVFWLEMTREATERQTEPIRTDLYGALDIRDNIKIVSLALTVAFTAMTVVVVLRAVMQCIVTKRRRPAVYERENHGRSSLAFVL